MSAVVKLVMRRMVMTGFRAAHSREGFAGTARMRRLAHLGSAVTTRGLARLGSAAGDVGLTHLGFALDVAHGVHAPAGPGLTRTGRTLGLMLILVTKAALVLGLAAIWLATSWRGSARLRGAWPLSLLIGARPGISSLGPPLLSGGLAFAYVV